MGKALGSGNTGQLRRPHGVRLTVAGNLQKGLNRRSARDLTHTYTYTHMYIYMGEAARET